MIRFRSDHFGVILPPPPSPARDAWGHICVTHSRNQEDTGVHARTRRQSKLSTGGRGRNRRDTGGHATNTVRDREAPGSSPGPPTIFEFEIGDFWRRPEPPGHSRGTISWE